MNKNKIIALIIFLIFFILSVSTYYNVEKQKEYIEVRHSQTFETMQQMIDGKVIFFRKQLATRIRNVVHISPLKKAILSKNKEKVIKVLDGIFLILKKENRYTKTLKYISPNNITIYRANKPNFYSDNSVDIYPVVKYKNKHKKAKYSFKKSNNTVLYKIEIPIVYGDNYYGILEYSVDPKLFIDDLTSISNYIKSVVLVKKNDSIDKISSSKIGKNYIALYSSNFFKNIDIRNLSNNDHFKYKGQVYTSFIYNLLTYQGNKDGIILIAINITSDINRINSIIKISIINQLLLIFIIFVIIFYSFKFYEKQIQKLSEEEKQHERILQQQSKMASMGEMIGNIAHQWRQPLSVISTIASGIVVQKEYGILKEENIPTSMNTILKQTTHMSNTIEDFRNFFKSDKENTTFNLEIIIKHNLALIASSLKNNNIELLQDVNKDIYVTGYQNELTQAILNILNNAKDQLAKEQKDNSKFIKINIYKDDKNAYIEIMDNGGGIKNDIIKKIFEPYFTTKHQSQGTGIGLYMTYEIVVKHYSGDILVENGEFNFNGKNYKGAKFIIILPLTNE